MPANVAGEPICAAVAYPMPVPGVDAAALLEMPPPFHDPPMREVERVRELATARRCHVVTA
jgi:hypothetical protein